MRFIVNTRLRNLAVLALGTGLLLVMYAEVDACTRVFWNTLSDLKIVARNEDYLTPVDPTMVITPRGIARVGSKEDRAVSWKSKYGNVCMYANNRFPMDGINEKGLTARTLIFTQGKVRSISARMRVSARFTCSTSTPSAVSSAT